MSFQKKYWYTFKDLKNIQYTVEIWQDTTDIITAEEIRGDQDPFLIQYSDISKLESIRGSGCELNLLSSTDRKFMSLYTANMMEFQIRVYNGVNLIWLGYLDSELYSEPFNQIKNYPVRFSGTDGFALLERFNYLDINGNKYTGLDTQWNVIKNIISKLNLGYNGIYISLSTTSNDFSISYNETIFHKTYCNNKNWYNEDGDAETTRKVLEEILKPYGAYIIQDNANLYIVDINTIAKNLTSSFRRYNSSFNYVSTVDLNLNIGDLTTIKFAESNQQLNVVSGINKQIIKYSPYLESTILDYDSSKDFSGYTLTNLKGEYPNSWEENVYSTSDYWSNNSNGRFIELVGTGNNDGNKEKYLSINSLNTSLSNNVFSYKGETPQIISNADVVYYLKFDCSCYVRTTDNMGLTTDVIVNQCAIDSRLKIGNKYLVGGDSFNWSTSSGYFQFRYDNYNAENNIWNTITDTWSNVKQTKTSKNTGIIVPLDTYGGTNFSFDIINVVCFDKNSNIITNSDVKEIRLKDIKISLLDKDFNEIKNSDTEYVGYLNKNHKNEGDIITILQGSSVNKAPIEKGSLMGYNGNYYYLNSWTREGKMDLLENLLLRSIVSNYTNKTIELTATINKINSIVGCLTYQSFLPNKVFMIVGCEQNLSENTSTIRLQEISIDNLEINKSW